MPEPITSYIGLDIHKDTIAIAVAESGRAPPRFIGTTTPTPTALSKALHKVSDTAHAHIVYEAGPTGYGWVRYLRAQGWQCEVIAPSRIARSTADKRIKTDRRDAVLLARESRAGNLTPVIVPDARDEAMRDLVRAREDACNARQRAHQQLKGMLLRHGRTCQGKRGWSAAHERTLAQIRFEHPAQELAFTEYRAAVKDATEQVERLTEALRTQYTSWRMAPVVKALMCFRGFDLIAAVTLIAELGDLSRFPHPRALMAYLGLVPSEHTSGPTRHLGPITKMGNKHARRILIEAAWNYRHHAKIGRPLEVRQQKQPKAVRDIAWKAQLRLTKRYQALNHRGLAHNKICVAIARELCGFIWAVAQEVKTLEAKAQAAKAKAGTVSA